MPLYPSLEDMTVHQMAREQAAQLTFSHPPAPAPTAPGLYSLHPEAPAGPSAPPHVATAPGALYPTLMDDYMGFDLKALRSKESSGIDDTTVATRPMYESPAPAYEPSSRALSNFVAPLSGTSAGLVRAHVTHGIREIRLCKSTDGKVGLRAKAISNGIFVQLVEKNSPAALAGLRFGDQILQIDGEAVAGYSMDKTHKIFRNCPANGIRLAVRDRPFERTVTLHKSSDGFVGFQFKEGKVISIVKDSSAARNGLLTDHHLLEVNGQNVVGLKDKEITKIIQDAGGVITLTIMPTVLYEHIMKQMSFSLVKSSMDHGVRDF